LSAGSYDEQRQVQLTLEPELREALPDADGIRLRRHTCALRGGEESANWRTQTDAADDAINFVRLRLRAEMRMALAARERGEPLDEEYFNEEFDAFGSLRNVTWPSSS
jgi:hypothetical protein